MRYRDQVPKLSWPQILIISAVITLVIIISARLYDQQQSNNSSHSYKGGHTQPTLSLTPASSGQSHVLVTGGAGYIGSHAALRLLEEGYAVTVIDNLSRGNRGAIDVLEKFTPERGGKVFNYVQGDLGDLETVRAIFRSVKIDAVMHFAAVAYVAESVAEPNRYYQNITSNTVNILIAMKETNVKKLVYSSTCAVYGNPPELPVTEKTPANPINPYGQAKLFSESVVRDYAQSDPEFKAVIFRYFNVYGSDPEGRLGEYPRPELRHYGRISGACLDAALGEIEALTIKGTTHPTKDGTCIRDYIHVSDLVSAHIMGINFLQNPPALFNIGTGNGVSVKEFVEGCKTATGQNIKVIEQKEARPGDYAALYSNVSKIETVMGWKAKYTNVVDSLSHAWKWRIENPYGYGTKFDKNTRIDLKQVSST
eukprot:TRINITY_DN36951_c0_g1_i1.p1 TRINITY_DN36951_c0_g1~~TRINITY_DN36951_c0_g1_i1.p1  ORF type:complete len:450 (-),score=50.54 TRINITY_DN36951_c0_g1_i1:384-1655(-)